MQGHQAVLVTSFNGTGEKTPKVLHMTHLNPF